MKIIFVILVLIFPQLSFADSAIITQELKCGISGCVLKCASEDGTFKKIGKADSVILKSLPGGISQFELQHTHREISTIIVGPKSYFCKVTGQVR